MGEPSRAAVRARSTRSYPDARDLAVPPAVEGVRSSSLFHNLCCYGSLLVMSPQVIAAIIAAGVGLLTVAATVTVQVSGRRATSRDIQKAFKEQREQPGVSQF